MGHVVLMSNHLVKYSQLPDVPADIVAYFEVETWKDYEKLSLAETNQRDSKPLGGHRPLAAATVDDLQVRSTTMEGDAGADQVNREKESSFLFSQNWPSDLFLPSLLVSCATK